MLDAGLPGTHGSLLQTERIVCRIHAYTLTSHLQQSILQSSLKQSNAFSFWYYSHTFLFTTLVTILQATAYRCEQVEWYFKNRAHSDLAIAMSSFWPRPTVPPLWTMRFLAQMKELVTKAFLLGLFKIEELLCLV
jgi:hypothetical protein